MSGRIAIHEAGHCVAARFYGLPIKSATIAPGEYFAGQVLAPEAHGDTSPAAVIARASELCDQVISALPRPGEDPASAAPWLAHTWCRVVELVAGVEAEKLADVVTDDRSGETDLRLAKIYAATICSSPDGVDLFLELCAVEARAILRRFWSAVCAVAEALGTAETLTGVEIDAVIVEAVGQAAQAAEIARREDAAERAERARIFEARRFQDNQKSSTADFSPWET